MHPEVTIKCSQLFPSTFRMKRRPKITSQSMRTNIPSCHIANRDLSPWS